MKILHTARWFFPHTGGGAIRVYNIAKSLIELGHEVHLLVHHPKSIDQCNLEHNTKEILGYENYDGIHVHRLPYFPPNFLYWSFSIPMMSKKAIALIRRHKIDVILSDNPPYLVGSASYVAGKMTNTPMVINVHDIWGASHYSSLQFKAGAALEKFCTRRIKRFVTASEGLRIVLSESFSIPVENIGVAANAIDLSRFNVSEDTITQTLKRYSQFNLKRDGKYIIFVGILRKWAGVQFLIEAFSRVVKTHPDYKLLLVGGGGDLTFFQELSQKYQVEENVIFTDSLPYSDVPAIISIASIACAPFPSTKVTDQKKLMSPLKILEYMAAGKAVIASRVGGMENYIQENETGMMFTPENVDELAKKLTELIEQPELMQQLGKNAKNYVQDERFGWGVSAKVVEEALQQSFNERNQTFTGNLA